jgi:hypothetical protein
MTNLHPPSYLWSPEQQQVVIAMLMEGKTAGQIAHKFRITRNAAIGRIARNPDLHQYVRRPPGKLPKLRAPRLKKIKEIKVIELFIPVEPAPQLGPMRLMPLIDTGSRFCKWPIAYDARLSWLCCGRQVGFGLVYCEPHRRQGHQRRAE